MPVVASAVHAKLYISSQETIGPHRPTLDAICEAWHEHISPSCHSPGSQTTLERYIKPHPGALAGELNTIRGQPLLPSVLPAPEASDAEEPDGDLASPLLPASGTAM